MKHDLRIDIRERIRLAGVVAILIASAVAMPLFARSAAAQMTMVMPPTEDLSFNRPESWALAHFTSATLLSGLDTPSTRNPGDISVGVEFGWLPRLSDAQRRVGYNGTEEQDLNKAPFYPRPRVSIGLPARFSLIVAAIPPIRMFGVKSSLVAFGVERPIIESQRWALGLRGYGQLGWVRGAYTCPQSVIAFAPGSPNNMGGCQAPSNDKASLRYAGGEMTIAYRSQSPRQLSPHASIGVSYMDVGFRVDALTYGYIDHTSYLSHGAAMSASGGVSYLLAPRLVVGVDVFYSPLSVRRESGAPVQTDGLFNVRALVTYRFK